MLWVVALWLAAAGPGALALGLGLGRANASCSGRARDGEALLGALLPLHAGPHCSRPELGGAQQEAALRAALDRANRDLRRDGISIALRILDTCAQPEEAVKAAMRALVAADQTCLHPPLFLGLLGPEDPASLRAALKVTTVFNTQHIVPWGFAGDDDDVLYVAQQDSEERAKGLLLLVRRLRWPSLQLVLGEDRASQDTGDELVRLANEDPEVCVQRRVLRLAEDSDIAWTISKDTSAGVVLIAESMDSVLGVLARLSSLTLSVPVQALVSVRQLPSGSSSQLSRLHGIGVTLLHEVSPASLVPSTQRALLAESALWESLSDQDISVATGLLPDSQDVSVGALSIGVQLVASALRAAHRIKCPASLAHPPPGETSSPPSPPAIFCPALHAMAPDEWRSILERVTAFADTSGSSSGQPLPSKLRFGMELRSASRVLVKHSDADELERAGLLVGGKELQLDSPRFTFPAPRPGADEDCGGGGASSRGSSTEVTTTSQRPVTKTKYNRALDRFPQTTPETRRPSGGGLDVDWSWIFGTTSGGVWSSRDYDFYQMLYMLCGAGAVMLIIFLLCFYIVYRSFNVKSGHNDRQRDNDSNSSPRSRASSKS